jgi:hypothetical protein
MYSIVGDVESDEVGWNGMAWHGLEWNGRVPVVRLLDEEQNMVCVPTYAPSHICNCRIFLLLWGRVWPIGIKFWKLICNLKEAATGARGFVP